MVSSSRSEVLSQSTKRRSSMSLILFVMVIAMLMIDTALYIIDINNTIKEVSYTLTSDAPLPLADRYALTNNLPWPAESALYAFLVRSSTVNTYLSTDPLTSSPTSEMLLSSGGYMSSTQ